MYVFFFCPGDCKKLFPLVFSEAMIGVSFAELWTILICFATVDGNSLSHERLPFSKTGFFYQITHWPICLFCNTWTFITKSWKVMYNIDIQEILKYTIVKLISTIRLYFKRFYLRCLSIFQKFICYCLSIFILPTNTPNRFREVINNNEIISKMVIIWVFVVRDVHLINIPRFINIILFVR